MSLSKTVVHGWAPEAVEEIDPISLASSKYWEFGRNTERFEFGVEQHEWTPQYYNNRDPNALVLSKASADNTIAFQPVNALWWYYFLGDSATVGSVHTITGINSGKLPTLTYRWEDRGGSVDRYSSVVGNVVESLVFSCNFGNQAAIPAVMAINLAGIKHTTPTLNSTHNGVKYPTDDGLMDGTQKDYAYRAPPSFRWDSAGDNVDYSNVIEHLQYTGANLLQKQERINQAEREYIWSGNRVHSLIFRLKRGTNASLFDDFNARTLHNAIFAVLNDNGTGILTINFNDIGINRLRQPYSPLNESPYWQVEAIVKSISVEANDGIAASYYGD